MSAVMNRREFLGTTVATAAAGSLVFGFPTMAAAALLKKNPKPTDADIDAEITNICRCGTFNRVRAAIKEAAGVTKTAGLDIIHVTRSVA